MSKTAVKEKPVTPASFKGLKDIDIPVTAKPAFNDLVLTTRDGAIEWLEANIRKGRDEGSFTTDEVLTGALARELLDRNPNNRPASKATIEEMVTAMKAEIGPNGFDAMNGETIKISICGLLNDGQHRLHARLDSGVDFRTRFIFGLPRESRLTIDQGKQRRAGDYISMGGKDRGMQVAQVALLLYYWRTFGSIKKPGGRSGKILRPGPSKMAQYANENYELITRSLDAVPRDGLKFAGGLRLVGFTHIAFAEKSFGDATDFIHRLVTGEALSERSPVRVCRERLFRSERLRREERFELMVRAWNAWREKRELATIPLHNRLPAIV